MPKSRSKRHNDFQKVKFKVGKKLPKAENYTSTTFKSKSIVIKEQLKSSVADCSFQSTQKRLKEPTVSSKPSWSLGLYSPHAHSRFVDLFLTEYRYFVNEMLMLFQQVSRSKSKDSSIKSIKYELLAHLQHYNPAFRLNSLNAILSMAEGSEKLRSLPHLGSLIDKVTSLISDGERDIRSAALDCLRKVLCVLNRDVVKAFDSILTTYLQYAMTHIDEAVRLDSIKLLDVLLSVCPDCMGKDLFKILGCYLDLVSYKSSKGKRALKVNPNSKLSTAEWREETFSYLEALLSIKFTCGFGALENEWRNSSGLPSANFSCGLVQKKTEQHAFLSLNSLEFFRHGGNGSGSDDVSEMCLFIRELMPVVRECWIDVTTDNEQLSTGQCACLLSLISTLDHLYNLVREMADDRLATMIKLLYSEVDFFLKNCFPIKIKTKKYDENCLQVNLRLCTLAQELGCGNVNAHVFIRNEFMESSTAMLPHMLRLLAQSDYSQELIVQKLAQVNPNEELFCEILESLYEHLYRYAVISCHQELCHSLIMLMRKVKPSVRGLMCVLKIFGVMGKKSSINEEIYIALVTEISIALRKEEKTSIIVMREVLSLSYYVSALGRDVLTEMKKLLDHHGNPALFNLALSIISRKYEQSDVDDAIFVSFLCSLLTGYDCSFKLRQSKIVVPCVVNLTLSSFECLDVVVTLLANYLHAFFDVDNLPELTCKNLLATVDSPLRLTSTLLAYAVRRYLLVDVSRADQLQHDVSILLNNCLLKRPDVLERIYCDLVTQLENAELSQLHETFAIVNETVGKAWHAGLSKPLCRAMFQALKDVSREYGWTDRFYVYKELLDDLEGD